MVVVTNQLYVIDASVLLSSLRLSEPDHVESLRLLKQIERSGWQIYVPTILMAEIAAGITRNMGKARRAQQVLAMIASQTHIDIVDVDERLGGLAATIAAQQLIRGCDAIYVALAQMRNATLITLDLEQRDHVPVDVIARTPAQELVHLLQ